MSRIALCCAAFAVAIPALLLANSGHDPVIEAGTVSSDMPPVRFQENKQVVIYFTDQTGIEKYCGKAQPGNILIACHRKHQLTGTSVLFMPNPCASGGLEYYARIACHELGHANGWGGNHEL